MVWLVFRLGGGEFLKLLLGHRFHHLPRRALKLALGRLTALCRQRCASGLLLSFLFGWHGLLLPLRVFRMTRSKKPVQIALTANWTGNLY